MPRWYHLFRCVCKQKHKVAQAFAVGQLPEHHAEQLVPTGETLHVVITFITCDTGIEVIWVHHRNDLGKNIFAKIHPQITLKNLKSFEP